MKLTKLATVVFITSITTLMCNAQVGSISDGQDVINLKSIIENNPKEISSNSILDKPNLQGSPYYKEDFLNGKIIDKQNNKQIDNLDLRYRILDDIIQINNTSSKTPGSLERSKNFIVYINGEKFVFLENYPIALNGTTNGYSIEKYKSKKVSLLKRLTQEYKEGRESENSYSAAIPPKLENNVHYFVKLNNGGFFVVEPHKKRALDNFPNHQKELKKFIKDNKLKFRGNDEESDLIKLVEYYNSII